MWWWPLLSCVFFCCTSHLGFRGSCWLIKHAETSIIVLMIFCCYCQQLQIQSRSLKYLLPCGVDTVSSKTGSGYACWGLWHLWPENLRKTGISVYHLSSDLGQVRQARTKEVTMLDDSLFEDFFHFSVLIRANRIRVSVLGPLDRFGIACHYSTLFTPVPL
jgi:hypothetical protein